MHTVWKGSISFGLVNIPVKLHAATENKDIKLRQLHKECHTPISYKKVCEGCNQEVKDEDIVKAGLITQGKWCNVINLINKGFDKGYCAQPFPP